MENRKRRGFLCLVLAVLLLVGCRTENPAQEGTGTGTATGEPTGTAPDLSFRSYRIVRAETVSADLSDAIMVLNQRIRQVSGWSMPVLTDADAGQEAPCEILIGKTARAASGEACAALEPGQYVIRSVPAGDGMKIVLAGADEAFTIRAVQVFAELYASGGVLSADGTVKTLYQMTDVYAPYRSFRIELSEPTVVAQPAEEDNVWGHYQFPVPYETSKGNIMAKWTMHNDLIEGGSTKALISTDGGKTWGEATEGDVQLYGRKLRTGKYFLGFRSGGVIEADYLDRYKPVCTGTDGTRVYLAGDIRELDSTVYAQEYDPATGRIETFPVTMNWPYMPVTAYPPLSEGGKDRIISVSASLSKNGAYGMVSKDGDLYYCTYTRGINSATGTASRYSGWYSVFVFRSQDNGRTWDYLSQISVTRESFVQDSAFEGPNEVMMDFMQDGSLVLLYRTGCDFANKQGMPCYLVRSTDNGKTWSAPVRFGDVGVLPQIRMLGCGVTLAIYGRPGLFLRATSDSAGLAWEDPIELPLSAGSEWRSCYYTNLLPLSDNTALLIYSDFHYPNQNGSGVRKTILVRTVTVVPGSQT